MSNSYHIHPLEWISVDVDLPELEEYVFACTTKGEIYEVCIYRKNPVSKIYFWGFQMEGYFDDIEDPVVLWARKPKVDIINANNGKKLIIDHEKARAVWSEEMEPSIGLSEELFKESKTFSYTPENEPQEDLTIIIKKENGELLSDSEIEEIKKKYKISDISISLNLDQ